MIEYWSARRHFIEGWGPITWDEWADRRAAAHQWEKSQRELGNRMNLSVNPPGKKFVIDRSLPIAADVLRGKVNGIA